LDEHGFYGKNETMKLRLLKEWNGKAPGKVGVFLSEYGEQMIKDGIAELLDEALLLNKCRRKRRLSKIQSIFLFQSLIHILTTKSKKKELLNRKKINKHGNYWHY
jgi:hypothetical protein